MALSRLAAAKEKDAEGKKNLEDASIMLQRLHDLEVAAKKKQDEIDAAKKRNVDAKMVAATFIGAAFQVIVAGVAATADVRRSLEVDWGGILSLEYVGYTLFAVLLPSNEALWSNEERSGFLYLTILVYHFFFWEVVAYGLYAIVLLLFVLVTGILSIGYVAVFTLQACLFVKNNVLSTSMYALHGAFCVNWLLLHDSLRDSMDYYKLTSVEFELRKVVRGRHVHDVMRESGLRPLGWKMSLLCGSGVRKILIICPVLQYLLLIRYRGWAPIMAGIVAPLTSTGIYFVIMIVREVFANYYREMVQMRGNTNAVMRLRA